MSTAKHRLMADDFFWPQSWLQYLAMRKIISVLLVILLVSLFASCGEKHPAIVVAQKFMGYMITNDAKGAYSFFSSRIKNTTQFDEYEKMLAEAQPPKSQDGTANQPWLVENEKPKTTFDIRRFDNSLGQAYVYGDLDQPLVGKASFRIRMVEEEGKWLVDTHMLQLENVSMPGFFSNDELSKQAVEYFNWMMDGHAEKMYEKVSKRVREKIPKDVFAVEAVGTSSGVAPRKEGFSFELHVTFANDFGKGYVVGEILYVGNSMTEFELPFLLEDGSWKADFSKVTPK